MHRRAREHVGLVIKRKLMRRQRRIINSIKGGWRIYLCWAMNKMVLLHYGRLLSEEDIYNETTFRSQSYKGDK